MAKYIINRKPIEVDLGEEQFLLIQKPGFIKILPLLEKAKTEKTSESIKLNVDFICDIAVGWKGIVDENDANVEFSKELLQQLLESLSAEDYVMVSNKIADIIKDVLKVAEKKDAELKN